ncbi:loganic acid O-methyltransferase-like [Tripterygium wilfordii]|uniref:loganic acid O-methyltransferase-like n=1 Tax=Tripterygium wilfordii TaxID=458696 RepID=UPI0018F85845|nr:loganic acid O-methyltransferase-like [Tripterygium wilfordii]
MGKDVAAAHPMNSEGSHSYTNNSSFQRGATDDTKELIKTMIMDKLDLDNFSMANTFSIADLGCSVGPNTFIAVENILEAVEVKYESQGLESPEFQVFLNDHTENDFNKLFKSLPPSRKYCAMGVPGSFYGRLFPTSSLHFVYTYYALNWLSSVPKSVSDKSSPAWNKGRISHCNAGDEVVEAYSAQFEQDMETFFKARAQEIVHGGLMTIFAPARPNGKTTHSESSVNLCFYLLGCCLMDMAQKGLIDEEKVDSFNLPVYAASCEEMKAAVERNGSFSIEAMELLPQRKPINGSNLLFAAARMISAHTRASLEGLLKEHFGDDICLDDLFDMHAKKIQDSFSFNRTLLFILLKRK